MTRIARTTLLATCLALAACAGLARSESERSATLIRDEWGVPHIFAASEEAGYYALGYAFGEDRLQRFLGTVLFSRGELASLIGPNALEGDVANRMWRHREAAEAALAQLGPNITRNYAAFLTGLADYAEASQPGSQYAQMARSLNVADIIAVTRAVFYTGYHTQNAMVECGVGGMVYSKAFLPYRDANSPASNGWVVMPSRTRDGALILAADPHVEVESVAYYEYHLDAGGLHSAGFALGPALWQAHTEHLAWAMTTGSPDFIDCYEIETDAADPQLYLFDGEPRRIERRTETFVVAGGEPVQRVIEYARVNGILSPVVIRRDGKIFVAVAADAERAGLMHVEFDGLNRARNVGEARAALATLAMFPQNLTIGDADGHVLYLRAGAAPRRPAGYDWTKPVPGNSSATAWQGSLSIDDLVQVADPEAGYLQNNNVSPDAMAAKPPVDAASYAPDIFFDMPGRQTSRGARTVAVLSANAQMTLDDAMALAFDERWTTADEWIAALRYAVAKRPRFVAKASAAFRETAARIEAFDGVADKDSEAAADFYFWRKAANAFLAKLEDRWFVAHPWDEARFTPAFADALLKALAQSIEDREAAYGTSRQKLGDVVRFTRGTADASAGGVTLDSDLAPLCVELLRAVCERTMRAFGVAPLGDSGRFRVVRGSQAMRLVEFGPKLRAFTLYAFGQSDDPASPHYADQVKLFSEERMKPAPFARAELDGHIESERVLTMPEPAN